MPISIDVLKQIILDYQEAELFTGLPRQLDVQPVPGKATICTGVRRSGKSTYMNQLMRKLLDSGVKRENIFNLNFFDDRLHELQHESLSVVVDAYYRLYPEKKTSERVYFFFDEIQAIPNWERFVDRLLRTENCQVYITGSSAKLLSTEIASQMRGRALSWEIFPFSFKEFLELKGVKIDSAKLSSKSGLSAQKVFDEFWDCGGFPEVANLSPMLRLRTHQEYLNALLFRDIIERHDIGHPKALSDLVHWLLDNTASMYSINRLTGYLQSLGHKAPKSAVADYLQWIEDAYFLFTVRTFDASLAKSNTNPKKVFSVDHAFVRSTSSGVLVNAGHLLENIVFTSLRRTGSKVFYFKSKSGREVDFVSRRMDGSIRLVQVCESMLNESTRRREVLAIQDAMRELKLKEATIVTRNEHDVLKLDEGTVAILPIWRFLLQ